LKAPARNYGDVWFSYDAITNILCLKNVVKKGCRVTHDSSRDGAFIAHKPNGETMRFERHPNGLHFYNAKKKKHLSMVTTVKDTSEGYSQQQLHKAKLAREFQAKVGHPSTPDLKNIIKSNMIANNPHSVADVDRAEKIYGPSVPILKGKTVRKTPIPVASDYIAVPKSVLQANKNVTLFGDIFFINKVPFFATISDHIKFTTAKHMKSRKADEIVLCLKMTKDIHAARGFVPKIAIMDGEFASVKQDVLKLQMQLNTTAANEHVPKIERQIRVIKERARCVHHALPFKFIPLLINIKNL